MRTEIKHVLKSMSPLLIEVPKKLSSPSLIGSSHKLQTNERRNSFADYFNRSEMRLRLGFLRRRSTESSNSARPSPEEAQKWTESFADLMASKYGATLYQAFLMREFSNENLEFWVAVEEYKVLKPQKMATKAQKVYNDFIAVQAPKEVNLDSETRQMTLNNVQSNSSDPHAFDRAQRRIQNMMERDSYQRFIVSDLVLELIHPERYPAGHSSGNAA